MFKGGEKGGIDSPFRAHAIGKVSEKGKGKRGSQNFPSFLWKIMEKTGEKRL